MPHLSKQKLNQNILDDIEKKVVSLITEFNAKKRKLIIRELLTHTERLMIAKRLTLLILIKHSIPTRKICSLLKVSPSTVQRFESKASSHQFVETLNWIEETTAVRSLVSRMILELLSIPFKAQKQSLYQMLQEL